MVCGTKKIIISPNTNHLNVYVKIDRNYPVVFTFKCLGGGSFQKQNASTSWEL